MVCSSFNPLQAWKAISCEPNTSTNFQVESLTHSAQTKQLQSYFMWKFLDPFNLSLVHWIHNCELRDQLEGVRTAAPLWVIGWEGSLFRTHLDSTELWNWYQMLESSCIRSQTRFGIIKSHHFMKSFEDTIVQFNVTSFSLLLSV